MDSIKVARDYWLSSQSSLLIPNREYGSRKLIHVGLSRNASSPSILAQATPDKREQQAAAPNMRSGKQWVHPPDSLLQGYISYTAKFLGECTVEQAKGTVVVKDAIRKMKFNKHIKRAEGQKPPKVELTISADGVTIIDPKTKRIMHSHPLHRISYCADDKSDKRMFSFIAKSSDSNQHHCYVFDSEKCAEEITLTVGQAFDLAYRRFLETSGKEMDYKKQYLALQKQLQSLQYENEQLKKRISELEKLKDRTDLAEYMKSNQISSLQLVPPSEGQSSTEDGFKFEGNEARPQTTVGRRLENLILNTDATSSPGQTNGTIGSYSLQSPQSSGQAAPLLSPPPPSTRARTVGVARRVTSPPAPTQPHGQTVAGSSDPFGSPGGAASSFDDPFGMGSFTPNMSATSSMATEQDFMDIQAGFSRGLSIGTDDFSLDDLDPLNQRS